MSYLLALCLMSCILFNIGQALPESSIYRVFEWSYGRWGFSWKLRIPVYHYLAYTRITRDERFALGYGHMVTHDDVIVKELASSLLSKARKIGLDEVETANYILSFVQSISYKKDREMTRSRGEFPKFPVETIVEGWGDCEDTSILYAALMKAAGYDVVLLKIGEHMAVGVAFSKPIHGAYVPYKNKIYFYAETSSSLWRVGDIPSDLKYSSVQITEIPKNPMGTSLMAEKLYDEINYSPERLEKLEKEYQSLKSKYQSLQKHYDDLLRQVMRFNSENVKLKAENEVLANQLKSLQAMNSELKKENLNLRESMDNLGKFSSFLALELTATACVLTLVFYCVGKSSKRRGK